jgi:hypothetical protein
MPKKNTRPTASPAQVTAPPAGIQIPPAAHAVLALLDPLGGTTTAELAERAGLGRSTVTKALAALSEAALAVRKPGGHDGARRVADLWFAAAVTTAAPDRPQMADTAADGQSGADGQLSESAAGIKDGAEEAPGTEEPAPTPAEAGGTGTGPGAADGESGGQDGPRTAPGPVAAEVGQAPELETDDDAPRALSVGTEPTADGGQPGADQDSSGATASADAAQDQAKPAGESAPAASARLGKGELRDQVERHLRENPDRAWTPSAIAKALDRSAGAIKNAGDKLVALGSAVTFEDAPTRYQYSGNR